MENYFTNWVKWEERNRLEGMRYPGIYCIAVSNENIKNFEFIPALEYIGMTNSKGGLKSRLRQFDSTIKQKRRSHGGADRFLFKYQAYEAIKEHLYVAVRAFVCDTKNPSPNDLKVMGEVAKCEYDCWALYVEKNGRLPIFNDKKISPKFSKK